MKISGVRRPRSLAGIALVAASVLLVSGCGHGSKPSWQGGGSSAAGSSNSASPAPLPSTVAVVSPAADATDVVAVTPVKYTSDDPENTTVTVAGPDGAAVDGTVDKTAKTWTPTKALAYGTKYTITVT